MGRDRVDIAERLRHRMHMLAWWREQLRLHPGGLEPLATAARILGVQRQRVHQLVESGRLPSITMPGGNTQTDRFVPLDALLMAPSALDQGRPLRMNPDKGYLSRSRPTPNIYGRGGIPDPTGAKFGACQENSRPNA